MRLPVFETFLLMWLGRRIIEESAIIKLFHLSFWSTFTACTTLKRGYPRRSSIGAKKPFIANKGRLLSTRDTNSTYKDLALYDFERNAEIPESRACFTRCNSVYPVSIIIDAYGFGASPFWWTHLIKYKPLVGGIFQSVITKSESNYFSSKNALSASTASATLVMLKIVTMSEFESCHHRSTYANL